MPGRFARKGLRGAVLGLALAGLAACDEGAQGLALADPPSGETSGGGLFSRLTRPSAPEAPRSEVTLAGGDVVLAAPYGWCIEPQSLEARGQQGFALLVGCHGLGAAARGAYAPQGVLTVTVSRRRADGAADAVTALRAAVADQAVRREDRIDGVAVVQLRPEVASNASRLGDPVWRAVFVHEARAISLAAYGPEGGEIDGDVGARLLLAIADGIRGNRAQ